MKRKDERIKDAGLLGALVGLLVNGPRGALTLGLSSAAIQMGIEYPKESAETLRKLLEPKAQPKLREAETVNVEDRPTVADVELISCKTCGSFHRAFDCPGRPVQLRGVRRTRATKRRRNKK